MTAGWLPSEEDLGVTTEAEALRRISQGRAFDEQVLAFAARHPQASHTFQVMLEACGRAKVNKNDWRSGVRAERSKRLRVADGPPSSYRRTFKRGDHLELAHAMLDQVEPCPDYRAHDEGSLHRYDPASGLWIRVDRSAQAVAVHTFAGAAVHRASGELTDLLINTPVVDGAIEQAQHITRRPEFFAAAPVGLAFSDGFAHASPEGLRWDEHSPEHRARVGYSFSRPADDLTPAKWLAFLRQVWPVRLEDEEGNPRTVEEIEASAQDQAAKILLFQQFCGACLVGVATRFQTALILFGTGSNGKSTALKTIERLFPEGSLCHVAPQDMVDEYRLALLAGKRLNTVGELPTAAILESGKLKSVIDGTEVTGRQIRQEPITFTPRAGLIYSANLWPPVSDMSHGFWSRFAVLTFDQTFERGTAGEELDETLAREEGPAIIGWMLDGAASVLRSRGYAIPASSRTAIDEWRNQACTVMAFLRECCEVPPPEASKVAREAYRESASKLFDSYVRHTREGQRPVVSRQSFSNRMAGLGHKALKLATANFYPVRLRLV